jgi:hypothetical protein
MNVMCENFLEIVFRFMSFYSLYPFTLAQAYYKLGNIWQL